MFFCTIPWRIFFPLFSQQNTIFLLLQIQPTNEDVVGEVYGYDKDSDIVLLRKRIRVFLIFHGWGISAPDDNFMLSFALFFFFHSSRGTTCRQSIVIPICCRWRGGRGKDIIPPGVVGEGEKGEWYYFHGFRLKSFPREANKLQMRRRKKAGDIGDKRKVIQSIVHKMSFFWWLIQCVWKHL